MELARKPIRDLVLVRLEDKKETVSPGGILISHIEEKVVSGIVEGVGNGHLCNNGEVVPLEVVIGDQVFFNKTMGIEVPGDSSLRLVREEHLLYKMV